MVGGTSLWDTGQFRLISPLFIPAFRSVGNYQGTARRFEFAAGQYLISSRNGVVVGFDPFLEPSQMASFNADCT